MVLPLTLTIYNQVNNVNYPKLMDYWKLLEGMVHKNKRWCLSTSALWNNIKTPKYFVKPAQDCQIVRSNSSLRYCI